MGIVLATCWIRVAERATCLVRTVHVWASTQPPSGCIKMLKDTVIAYTSPDIILTNLRHTPKKGKQWIQARIVLFCGCNAYTTAIKKDGEGIRLMVDISRGDTSSELNYYSLVLVKRNTRWKDYSLLDLFFTFMTDSINLATCLVEQAPMPRLHTIYFALVSSSIRYKGGKVTNDIRIKELR